MDIVLVTYTYFFIYVNSTKISKFNDESLSIMFENDEIEFNRNVNMGICCHTYNFNKILFYKLDSKSAFIDYLDKTKFLVTDRPTMSFISIILFSISNIKIMKNEVYKILQFITSMESYNEYPFNFQNIYKLEITKINPGQERKDLFNKLPNLNKLNCYSHEKLTQNVLNIFLLEDINQNRALKKVLKKEIEKFFFLNSEKNKKFVMMKILIIEAIKNPKKNLFVEMNTRYKENSILMESTIQRFFSAFDKVESRYSYSHVSTELSHKSKSFYIPGLFKTELYFSNNLSTLYLYKKSDINNLDYYIKFINKNIEFKIYKCIETNDTYTKLLNFLGYSPLEKFYFIQIILRNVDQSSFFFKIKVSMYKKIIKQANNQIPEIYKNIKHIIISRVNNDNIPNKFIDYSYEIDTHSSEGFPLSNVEREKIQEKEYNSNIEAKKLINFIDFYQSFMLGRDYFYFSKVYNGDIDFNTRFCFYKREVWFKYLDISQIYKIIVNSTNFQSSMELKKDLQIFKSLKKIEVYEFEREYTKKQNSNILNNDTEVLKGFENHHFLDVELLFYSNIQLVKYYNLKNKYPNINNFIKVDLGCNKTYFIFFREVQNNWTNNDKFYNINNINKEANEFLNPILKELLCLDDKDSKKYTNNFIFVIFNLTKLHLNENLALKNNLCYNLRRRLCYFLPKTRKLISDFLEIANNKQNLISLQRAMLISKLFKNTILIIKRNFKNILYEACVLRSISNIEDDSQKILESLL